MLHVYTLNSYTSTLIIKYELNWLINQAILANLQFYYLIIDYN